MPVFQTDVGQILFIHVPKTGGSSLYECLSQFHQHSPWTNSPLPGEPCTPQHYHRALLEHQFGSSDLTWSFMVVRHPADRLVSEYCWQMRNRMVAVPFGWWLRDVLSRMAADRYCFDNHLRPQHEFHCLGADVFRFEDGLDMAIKRMSRLTGIDYTPHLKHRKKRRPRLVRIGKSERALIEDTYRQDYDQFGYDR
jgi:hypothetical protein